MLPLWDRRTAAPTGCREGDAKSIQPERVDGSVLALTVEKNLTVRH